MLPKRYNISKNEMRYYKKEEYPNSFARLILGLHDTPKHETSEANSIEKFNIYQFKPEIHIFSLLYIEQLHPQKIISVGDVDRIAEKYRPLRHHFFSFFLKIILTSLFLYFIFHSIDKAGNDKFTTSLLPMLLTVAVLALVDKLCTPSNFDKTLQIQEDQIKSDFLE